MLKDATETKISDEKSVYVEKKSNNSNGKTESTSDYKRRNVSPISFMVLTNKSNIGSQYSPISLLDIISCLLPDI